jgi:hypothetical protein
MKSKKLLVVVMLASVFLAAPLKTLTATETGVLSVTSASAQAGQEVTLDVVIDENPGVVALAFSLSWGDNTRLTLISTDTSESKENYDFVIESKLEIANINGKYFFSSNSVGILDKTNTGKLVSLTFAVDKTTVVGDIELTLEVIGENTFSYNKIDVPFAANSGKIIVTDQTVPSSEPSLSPSVSPSESVTASISPSVSPSESITASISPSISPSESVTATASLSPSVSPSDSVTATASIIPSVSPSESVTASVSTSVSPSDSVTASVSPSVSPSESVTASISPSVSPSSTQTPATTGTPTYTTPTPLRTDPTPPPFFSTNAQIPAYSKITVSPPIGDYTADMYTEAELESALYLNDSPIIVLGGYKKGANISGKVVLDLAGKNKSIGVKKDDFTFSITPELASEFKIAADSTLAVEVVSGKAEAPRSEIERISKIDPINELMLERTYNLSISLDGKKITKTVSPIKIEVDVTGIGIENKANASGVYFNPVSKDLLKLGGEFDQNGRTFEFYTNNVGSVGLIVVDNLQKLSLTIGVKSAAKSENAAIKYIQNDVAPFISSENRTMIPLRLVAETMGAEVGWMESLSTATIKMNDKTIYLKVGAPLAEGMGTPTLSESRTFVPIRYVAESFNANVVWNAENKSVKIYY